MAKKSRRFAAKRSATTKRKKGKAGLSQRQIELSGVAVPTPAPSTAAEASAVEPADQESASAPDSEAPSDAAQQPLPPEPAAAIPAAAGAPWRYAYVLTDVKRIGMFTAVVALLLLVLTFILR